MSVGINKMPEIVSEKLYNFFGKRVAFTANNNMCWDWKSVKNEHGYGYFSVKEGGKNIKIKAHRFSFYIHHKIDPIGFLVRHKCDNPACCNPNHLELGTTQDNVDDMKKRGRMAVGEKCRNKRTAEEVLEIRRLFDEGMSRREIAEKFNIPRSSVISLILRREWKHI